jgi:hypothetical protein
MIRKLHELTDGKTEIPEFLGGSEYLTTIWLDIAAPIEWGTTLTAAAINHLTRYYERVLPPLSSTWPKTEAKVERPLHHVHF